MKIKFIAMLFFCATFFNANAQQGTAAGGAFLGLANLTGDHFTDGFNIGLSYGIEGKYYLMDNLAVGLEISRNGLAFADSSALVGANAFGSPAIVAKGEYFFGSGNVRPYVGVGIGGNRISTPEFEVNGVPVLAYNKFNLHVTPRAGVMFGGFGMEFAYHLAGKTPEVPERAFLSDQKFNFYDIKLKYIYTPGLN